MKKYKRMLLLGIFIIIFIGIIGILVKWDNYVLNKKSVLQNIPTDTYLVCIVNYTIIESNNEHRLDSIEEHTNYEDKAVLYITKAGLISLNFYEYNLSKLEYVPSKVMKIENNKAYFYEKGKITQNKHIKVLIKKTANHSYQIIYLDKDGKDKTYMGMGFTCK